MNEFELNIGKSYWYQQFLIEIDHDTGKAAIVERNCFPAGDKNHLLKRYKTRIAKSKKRKPKPVTDEIKPVSKQEILF